MNTMRKKINTFILVLVPFYALGIILGGTDVPIGGYLVWVNIVFALPLAIISTLYLFFKQNMITGKGEGNLIYLIRLLSLVVVLGSDYLLVNYLGVIQGNNVGWGGMIVGVQFFMSLPLVVLFSVLLSDYLYSFFYKLKGRG